MPTISEIRAQYPSHTQDKTDWDIAVDFAKANNVSPEVAAYRLGADLPEQNTSRLGDAWTALKRGGLNIPSTTTGLIDIPVAALTGRPMVSEGWDELGKLTGFRPSLWAKELEQQYSPAQQEFLQGAARTDSFGDSFKHYVTNPAGAAIQAVESVPGVFAGGAVAKGLQRAGALGAAARYGAGEGAVMAGQAMNQMVEDGVDPRRAAGYAAGVGALGGALGYGGGRLAERLGVVNPDELLGLGGRTALAEGATAPGLGRRVVGGMLSEGAFEEMPQSAMEAAMGNLAAERPWDQDVGKQAAAGLVLGGLMGGVVGVVPPARNPADPIDLLNRDTTPQAPTAPAAGLNLTNLAVPQQGIFNDPSQIEQWAGITPAPTAEQRASRAEDILAAFNTPVGEVGGRPVTAWEAFQREQGVPANRIQTGPAQLKEAAPKIDIPVPRPLQNDPVRSAVAQASPATLRRDGSLKRNVEEAIAEYEGFMSGEIERSIEALSTSRKAGAVWRVAALEAIARQRAAQGAPNVAQVDAASGQGAGAVPAGSAGNTPDRVVDLGGVRQPAGAPAPGSTASVPVGEPVVQQPTGVEDVIDAVSPVEQVAPQAEEARGQEGAPVSVPLRPTHRNQDVVDAAANTRLTELPPEQKRVYDYLIKAVYENRVDDIVDAQGVMQFTKIGKALGKERGSIDAAVKAVMKKLAATQGMSVDELKTALRERKTVAGGSDFERLGLSPAEQISVADGESVFGNDEGITPSMEIVDSVGKTNANPNAEKLGGTEEGDAILKAAGALTPRGMTNVANTPDPVAERRVAEAKARREAALDALMQRPEAAEAAVDWDDMRSDTGPTAAELSREDAVEWVLSYNEFKEGRLSEKELDTLQESIERRYEANPPRAAVGDEGAAGTRTGQPALAERSSTTGVDTGQQETDAREEVTSTPTARNVGRTAAREYAAGALTRLQQYYGTPNLAALASSLENASDLTSLDSELDTDPEWERDFNLSNDLAKVRRDAAAIERLAAAHPEAFELGYLRAQDYGGFASDTPVSELISHMTIASGRPSVEFGAARDYYMQRDAQASEGVNQTDSTTAGLGDGNRYSRTTDTQGTTVEAVRSAINDIATPMGRRKVTVYQTADEAVQSGALNSKDAKGTQGWVDAKGNAFFIAGNIPKGSELAVVLHEIGAHLGIEKLLTDKQYKALVKKIFAWAQSDANTQEARIARAALARVDAAKLDNEADVVPETIAYFVEEAVKAGVNPTAMQYKTELDRWFRTLWTAFKVALRRLNLINADRLTAQNVVDLAYGAANLELTGRLDAALDGEADGTPRASTNAFKRWFGDSKVVDENGNPLVVYHGTAADIEFFDPLALGGNTRAASAKKAFFFAASPKVASGYAILSESRPSMRVNIIKNAAESDVLPPSLRKFLDEQLNKPVSEGAKQEWAEAFEGVGEATPGANVLPVYLSVQNPMMVDYQGREYRERSFASVIAEAKQKGHDGVIFRNAEDSAHKDYAEVTDIIAVFRPEQIKSAISNNGNYDPTDRRIRFSKAADPQLTELAQESGQRAWAAIRAGIRKGWTGLAFSSHLANAAHRAGLTSARALELVQRKKATRAYEIQIEVEKVLSKFADLKGKINGQPASDVVQRFIYDATFDKKWGFAPDWKQDAVVDPEMERRFNALPTEAQTVIKDVFRHGDAIFKEKQDLLRKTITGEYEALIKAETDDGKRRKLERQRDKELREAGRLIAEMNGPYAPLRRYGNYVVVAKSQKYRDAEAAGPVDAKLKRDENHYVVEFAETLYEAERLQKVLEGKFGEGLVWAGEKETATEQFGELPFMAVQRLRKMVDTDLDGDLNTKSKRVLNKLLVDLYISTLHEANARHSEQKRQFVNRADRNLAAKDMMRAFATQGRADSHLVSALQFNSEIVDEMQKLRNEAKAEGGDSLLKTRLRNEILQRHMMDLDFRETPIQDKLMSLNSFWMLLTSPGYYVQNAFQVMMMTQPVLAGRFGQNRSMRQLMRGYQDAMRVLKGSSWNEAANLKGFNGTQGEMDMLSELQVRGTLDFGISAELGYWESRGEISKVFNQTMRKVGMATRKLEVMNRMSSALAAYRLMYDQTNGTQAERHAAALEYADTIIKDTHGDYSTANAPRYLRVLPKVMTQFRKFQLIQLSLFAKTIHGATRGATPQERTAMRAALGYLFMNHALLAGAVGVPASALLGAIYAIAGDDDDPNDWEVDVRRAIDDKEMADLILHGLPSLININMSNKIGAGTMLDPLPFVEYEATRGGYEKAVTAAMGPLIGGLGAQVVDAVGRIMQGDVAQGTAQLLPRGFRDAARGFMAAQDGIKLRNGQTALTPEELSFYDSLMMGLGLPTLKTTSRTETQFKSQQYEQFFRERVTKLKRQYSEAYEENDREAMLEARQAWAAMQASRKNLGFKVQPLSDLLKAPREKVKAEAKLENGIRTTEQARGFVKSLQ